MVIKKEGKIEILKTRNSRKIYIPLYLMIVILISTIFYIRISEKPVNEFALKLVFIFGIFILFITEVHRFGNSYEINDYSIVHRKGYLSVSSGRYEFGAISDSDVRQNLWQRLFSYGSVEVHLFSRENAIFIKNINDPYGFSHFLHRKISNFRGRNG